MAVALETERLILRPWAGEDAAALFEMCRDAETMRYVGDGRPWAGVERAREWLARKAAASAGREFGKWAVVEKGSGRLVGSCGFDPPSETMPEVELGYLFARDSWGRGYATEAAGACMRFAFDALRLPRVVARVSPANTPSRRVLEKLGFDFEGLRRFEGTDEPDAFYVARRRDPQTPYAD
ncbi:MAG TPA: GNAT family N-acetyltransferase [Pyrinomonadaceae bacterium]|nr:GNAT family N-acetyltransferase [Pyrinomonadaceae bacterium]